MKGFTSFPITQLRNLLRDQYDSSSIFKELIQNSDDAESTQLHLAWIDNWPNNSHPLLQSPAVVVLNNGKFDTNDAEAIFNLGAGAKGADTRTIGRFGLGMKSVFHWCESIFFLSSANQPAAESAPYAELLNPWTDDNLHENWANIDTATTVLLDRIAHWPHNCTRWFCIVLPLRSKLQLDGKFPLTENYPLIEQIFTPELEIELAHMLPLLGSLESIKIWNWNKVTDSFNESAAIQIQTTSTSRRTKDPEQATPGEQRRLSGNVIVTSQNHTDAKRIPYSGIEWLASDDRFESLTADEERWPPTDVFIPQQGYKQERLKGFPHAAVIFQGFPSKTDKSQWIRFKHAVFLPLAEIIEEARHEIDFDIEVILHGFFFLDSGRKSLYNAETSGGNIEAEWNAILQEAAVLPLILPAFKAWLDQVQLQEDKVTAITQALSGTTLFIGEIDVICAKYHWIWSIDAHAIQKGQWKLLESDIPYKALPEVGQGCEGLPFDVFPVLADHNEEFLTLHGRPNITPHKPVNWQSAEISPLINSVPTTVWTDENQLTYLNTTITQWKKDNVDSASLFHQLIDKAKAALVDSPNNEIHTNGVAFSSFVSTIPCHLWIALDIDEKSETNLLHGLYGIDLAHWIVPASLAPNEYQESLSIDESREIFIWLTLQTSITDEDKSRLALKVWEKTDGGIQAKQESLGDFPLFSISNYKDGSNRLASFNELDQFLTEQCLWAPGSSFTNSLQKALKDATFYRLITPIGIEPFNILFRRSGAPICNKKACYEILRAYPQLTPPESRSTLLDQLLGRPDGTSESDYKTIIRYLLTGYEAAANETDTPLLVPSRGSNDSILGRIVHQAIERTESQWRWVPSILYAKLSGDQIDDFDVQECDADVTQRLLDEVGYDWLGEVDLSENDRIDLLYKLRDSSFWHCLPLHRTSDDRLVSLDQSRIYIEPSIPFPISIELAQHVVFIQRPADRIAALYQNHIEAWAPEHALKEIVTLQIEESCFKDILTSLELSRNSIDSEIRNELKRRAWLPDRNGQSAICPNNIINLPDSGGNLEWWIIRPEIKDSYNSIHDIDQLALSHTGFSQVKRLLVPGTEKSLEMLGLSLSQNADYFIGELDALQEPMADNQWKSWYATMGNCDEDILPIVPLLQLLREHIDQSEVIQNKILIPLLKPIPIRKAVRCIDWLANQHEVAFANRKREWLKVHSDYLNMIVNHQEFSLNDLRPIRLLSRNGNWQSINDLCIPLEGIDEFHVIEPNQLKIIESQLSSQNQEIQSIQQSTERISAQALQSYFYPWEEFVPRQVIGAFLALLGDNRTIKDYANELLTPRSVEGFLHEVAKGCTDEHNSRAIYDQVAKQRIALSLHQGTDTQRVPNLLGSFFAARINTDFDSLIVGDCSPYRESGHQVYAITLRKIDPSAFAPAKLNDLLEKSARFLLDKIYKPCHTFDKIWQDISKGDQLHLAIVQEQLLDYAPFYLNQLGMRRLKSISPILKEWESLHDQTIEWEHAELYTGTETMPVRLRMTEQKKKLKTLIEKDINVQQEIVHAVRNRIGKESQYNYESIPFELFQNSDDAVVELMKVDGDGDDAPKQAQSIVVEWTGKSLFWTHWGRKINKYYGRKLLAEEGKELGFSRDLRKMLILSYSDKEGGTDQVTGKFGLGFKTVFLFCDRPRFISGSLSAEILASFLPRLLSEDKRQKLDERLKLLTDQPSDATIFEFPISQDAEVDQEKVLGHFRDLLPILLAFSRKIITCKLLIEDQDPILMTWRETKIHEKTIGIGNIDSAYSIQEIPAHMLVVRGENGSAVLFGLRPHGLCKLPNEVPTFWVTAPTDVRHSIGIAFNGPFALDIGRKQLAHSIDENIDTARKLGSCLGSALAVLANEASDWPVFCNKLHLDQRSTADEFWLSLWNLVSLERKAADSTALHLVHEIVWGDDCGYAALLKEHAILPTELSGEYGQLTLLENVRYRTEGILDKDTELFEGLSAWDDFKQRITPGTIISGQRIWKVLSNHLGETQLYPTKSIKIQQIIEWVLDGGHVIEPQQANKLGRLFSREYLNELRNKEGYDKEVTSLYDWLNSLEFISKKDQGCPSQDLIAAKHNPNDDQNFSDEELRAAFAPDSYILSSEYDKYGVVFFRACRKEMKAGSERMATWGKEEDIAEKRLAFLKYLLQGELRSDVANQVKNNLHSTWLGDIQNSELWHLQKNNEQLQLLAILGYTQDALNFTPPTPPAPIRRNPGQALESIYEWWMADKQEHVEQYERNIYPGRCFPPLIKSYEPDSIQEKVDWLQLFLIGSLHTLGRTQEEANKNFVSQCLQQGWLERMVQDNEPEKWLHAWGDYIEQQIDEIRYYYWMGHLSGLYLIARNLEEYITALLNIDRIDQPFPLEHISNPRASSIFDRGGPDALPIAPIMGIGECFVIRELSRHQIIKNDLAYPYCYVPVARVRRLINDLGGPDLESTRVKRWNRSRQIYEFLAHHLGREKASFGLCFDLPLQIISRDQKLWFDFTQIPFEENTEVML
jgi:hypothetical protein